MDRNSALKVPAAAPIVERAPGWALLLTGAIAMVLVGKRWNVGALAWVMPVPFLLYLWTRKGWRPKLALLGVVQVAMVLQVYKLVTAPMPAVIAVAYGVPLGLAAWIVYVAWDLLRRKVGDRAALYAYPALVALVEVLIYRLTEVGTWGSGAMTQLENLPLLQLASLFGSSAIGFVVAWTASLGALLLATRERRRYLPDAVVLALALVAVFAFGSFRLFSDQGRTVNVAGIMTDLGPGPGGLPDAAAISRNNEELFQRSATAADRGARLVAWNEGATVVGTAGEKDFVDRGTRFARERGVDLVLAYIVPVSTAPRQFRNKYVWIGEDGKVLETYEKHHPVPGEGSLRGTAPLLAMERPFGRSAGAICYDYDFPAMAVAHGRLGVGLVVLPASDWKGIDPYHSQNARIRAIEGGFNVLRPTRWSTSVAFDAYGRLRAELPAFETNERILIATLPTQHVPTLYSQIGDSVALVYAAYLLSLALRAVLKGRERGKARAPACKDARA